MNPQDAEVLMMISEAKKIAVGDLDRGGLQTLSRLSYEIGLLRDESTSSVSRSTSRNGRPEYEPPRPQTAREWETDMRERRRIDDDFRGEEDHRGRSRPRGPADLVTVIVRDRSPRDESTSLVSRSPSRNGRPEYERARPQTAREWEGDMRERRRRAESASRELAKREKSAERRHQVRERSRSSSTKSVITEIDEDEEHRRPWSPGAPDTVHFSEDRSPSRDRVSRSRTGYYD